jgi:hypothetical protein
MEVMGTILRAAIRSDGTNGLSSAAAPKKHKPPVRNKTSNLFITSPYIKLNFENDEVSDYPVIVTEGIAKIFELRFVKINIYMTNYAEICSAKLL